MQPILQMHLEIIHPHLRPWRIQLAWAILTLDSRIVHEFDIVWGWGVWTHADGEVGEGADGSVAHCTFEGVVRVGLLETGEGVGEPLGRLGLGGEED